MDTLLASQVFFALSTIIILIDAGMRTRTRDLERGLFQYISDMSLLIKGGKSVESSLIELNNNSYGESGRKMEDITELMQYGSTLEGAMKKVSSKTRSKVFKRITSLISTCMESKGSIGDRSEEHTSELQSH